MPAAFDPHRRSNAFSRERDARICWLLAMHPATAAMLMQLGWFGRKNKALQRLNRLVERKKIRLIGTVCEKPGRPENVYGRFPAKIDQLLHEVQLTRMCLRLDAEKILRGTHVIDTEIRPDAEVWINGQLYYLEWDRGSMGNAQIVRDRFSKYEDCRHLSLWICPTVLRRDGFRLRAERIRSTALFTTAEEALLDPHREIWMDFGGKRATLPRQAGNPEFSPGEKPG